MRFLLLLAGLASGSTLARVFVVIALLACGIPSTIRDRQKWEDLEVITLDSHDNLLFGSNIRYQAPNRLQGRMASRDRHRQFFRPPS
jgi:hypothetical protein